MNSTLVSISPSAAAVTLLDALGTGFNGGLAYDPAAKLFYAIGNDIDAQSSLYSITLGGTVSLVQTLGYGYFGGLALDGATFYAISGGGDGVQHWLESWTLGGPISELGLGDGAVAFSGGLTWTGGSLYAIGTDSKLYALPSLTLSKDLAPSVFGSLAFPAAGGLASDGAAWYALAVDDNSNQVLTRFSLGGPLGTIGSPLPGAFSGLVLADTGGTAVPEPATVALAGFALLLLAGWRRRF